MKVRAKQCISAMLGKSYDQNKRIKVGVDHSKREL